MDTWVDQLHRRAQILVDQIMAARIAATQSGADLSWLERQHRSMLERLYAEEYASAKLRDTSDLTVRAEGPGADHDAPELYSFNWLTDHVRRQLTKLGEAVIPLAADDAKAVAKKVAWIFTGYAPGSIMLGFALRRPEAVPGFERADEHAFALLDVAAQSIAMVPQFVDDDELRPEIGDVITEPALRDAAIMAAWQLAPTSQSRIHTIHVSSRRGDSGSLSMRERMVLKKSVDAPVLRKTKQGSFVGTMRAADLDKHRAVLRGIAAIGSIRCVLPAGLSEQMQSMFGHRVKVSGTYESNPSGRPSLMRVDSIEEAPRVQDLLGADID